MDMWLPHGDRQFNSADLDIVVGWMSIVFSCLGLLQNSPKNNTLWLRPTSPAVSTHPSKFQGSKYLCGQSNENATIICGVFVCFV